MVELANKAKEEMKMRTINAKISDEMFEKCKIEMATNGLRWSPYIEKILQERFKMD
jgi:predicted DNA binding CopG/RHH family protein